jgi:hypothetical protein
LVLIVLKATTTANKSEIISDERSLWTNQHLQQSSLILKRSFSCLSFLLSSSKSL